MRKPRIFQQGEKSYHCGACVVASVLDFFGVEPDPIPFLYNQLRAEGYRASKREHGLFLEQLQSYFMRRDWVALDARINGPSEPEDGSTEKFVPNCSQNNQRIALWRGIKRMLMDGYLCCMSYGTNYNTQHVVVLYDAFLRKNLHWIRIACSQQGYMELQALDFFKEGVVGSLLFVKPDNLELR